MLSNIRISSLMHLPQDFRFVREGENNVSARFTTVRACRKAIAFLQSIQMGSEILEMIYQKIKETKIRIIMYDKILLNNDPYSIKRI